MNSIFFIISTLIFSIHFAMASDDFSVCSGRYRVVKASGIRNGHRQTSFVQELIVTPKCIFTVKDQQILPALKLEAYSWSEEGYFGYAGFENSQNRCLWHQNHNAGGKSFEINMKPDGSAEAQEICSWSWVCHYENTYQLERIQSPMPPSFDSTNCSDQSAPGSGSGNWD